MGRQDRPPSAAGIGLAIILAAMIVIAAIAASAYEVVSPNKTITMAVQGNASAGNATAAAGNSGGDTGLYRGCYGCIVNRTREAIANWTREQATKRNLTIPAPAVVASSRGISAIVNVSDATPETQPSPEAVPTQEDTDATGASSTSDRRPAAAIDIIIGIVAIAGSILIIHYRPPWRDKSR